MNTSIVLPFSFAAGLALAGEPLPGTAPLTLSGDISAQMVAGIGRFLERETAAAAGRRAAVWQPDLRGDPPAYEESLRPNRARLARLLGVVDPRIRDLDIEFVATVATPALVAETDRFTIHAVRWPVLDGLSAEGLLLQPKSAPQACLVAVPDADQLPEALAGLTADLPAGRQYARRLAENGCHVLIPTLADRSDTFSGNATLKSFTNRPHREWIYRQAFTLGRHVIGYEVQQILAAVDWFARQNRGTSRRIGVVGWGEGGLLAFYGAALDSRISAALVSGYFGPRERLWEEPIYRNVFGLLNEFGDAEIARLIAPRSLLVEHTPPPLIDGPPAPRPGRAGAAPGKIVPLDLAAVRAEFARAQTLAGPHAAGLRLYHGDNDATLGPIAETTLLALLQALQPGAVALLPPGPPPRDLRRNFDPAARQERQVRGMENFTQRLVAGAHREREEFLWKKVAPTTPEAWHAALQPFREKLWHEHIGRFATGGFPLQPRSRLTHDRATWTAHEVVIDVLPDVFAWGYLLLPKGLKPGERRPVVVTQHGVRGLPADVINEDPAARAFRVYQAFAVRLAERGFVVFAPHNPYCGDDPSRLLQRKANPIGKTIFSVIVAQHERLLDWLGTLPQVDPARIGFYGLSYGGQTAMRVPVVLERYAVSICSGDFNEWTWKNVRTDWAGSYMFNAAWERPEFNLGMTFGYAELAALMVPRPFMVERGHNDSVGLDEWVAFEYAKVHRLYAKLQIPERTTIEYFNGPHMIHGTGTYRFLHHHLRWPEPPAPPKPE